MNLADGVHQLDRAQYDAVDRTNWSTLKHMAKSPAHFAFARRQAWKDTDPRKRGRATHLAVFEPELYRSGVIRWDGGPRRGKGWEAFQEEHAGKEILTEDAFDAVAATAEAVRADPVAAQFLVGGHAEVSVLWTHEAPDQGELLPAYRLGCKGRLDYVQTAELAPIVDLKTTRDASPEGFGRESWFYRYDAQAALYVDGFLAATGQRRPYVMVAVEAEAPHVVAVYRVPANVLDGGREHYRQLLARVAECRAQDRWPGYCEDVRELELPRWATAWTQDEDLSEAGLELGAA